MTMCAEAADIAATLTKTFVKLAMSKGFCLTSLPYVMDIVLLSLAVSVGTSAAPAIEQGSQEAEWETERVLQGIEARVLARVRETYARGREAGLTAETVRAMRERDAGDRGMQ
jgi:hypothetical protein